MRQRPKALGFAILLAPLAALHVGSPAQAASVALKCGRACHDRIAGCVAAGGRRGLCRKSMLGRCKREGVAVCQGQAGATTTSTTTPTTTTTLTGGGFLSGLVIDPTVVLTEPETPRPAYELPVRPAVFHVPIMRIANDPGLPTLPVSGTWGSDARHVYSKQQPWSADESLISIENSGGPSPLILDGFTNLPRYAPCSNYDLWDYRWHPSRAHAHEQINVDSSGTRLSWFDVVSCTETRSWSLPIAADYGIGHADGAVNPFDSNEDVLVGQDECLITGETVNGVLISHVMMARLRDGQITALTDPNNEAYAHHISTRNVNRPGWAYVDFYPEDGKRFSDEIIAVKLDGSHAVQRFAHKHSAFDGCYRCESHVAASMDGRRVLFASNWAHHCGASCGSPSDVEDYLIDARSP